MLAMKWPASTTGSGNAELQPVQLLRPRSGVTPEKTSIAPSITAKADSTSGTSAIVPLGERGVRGRRAPELGDRERDHRHGQRHT